MNQSRKSRQPDRFMLYMTLTLMLWALVFVVVLFSQAVNPVSSSTPPAAANTRPDAPRNPFSSGQFASPADNQFIPRPRRLDPVQLPPARAYTNVVFGDLDAPERVAINTFDHQDTQTSRDSASRTQRDSGTEATQVAADNRSRANLEHSTQDSLAQNTAAQNTAESNDNLPMSALEGMTDVTTSASNQTASTAEQSTSSQHLNTPSDAADIAPTNIAPTNIAPTEQADSTMLDSNALDSNSLDGNALDSNARGNNIAPAPTSSTANMPTNTAANTTTNVTTDNTAQITTDPANTAAPATSSTVTDVISQPSQSPAADIRLEPPPLLPSSNTAAVPTNPTAPTTAPPTAPPTTTAADLITVTFTSQPNGAEVILGEDVIGTTPLELRLPAAQDVFYTLTMPSSSSGTSGFRRYSSVINSTTDTTITVQLEPISSLPTADIEGFGTTNALRGNRANAQAVRDTVAALLEQANTEYQAAISNRHVARLQAEIDALEAELTRLDVILATPEATHNEP